MLPQQAAVVFCAQKQDATPSFTVQSSKVTQTASSWTSAKFRICLKGGMTEKGCGKQKWLYFLPTPEMTNTSQHRDFWFHSIISMQSHKWPSVKGHAVRFNIA